MASLPTGSASGWVFATAFALSLASTGCLLESHPPSDPVPFEGFCDAFFDALCEPLERCDCPLAATHACRAEARELCAGVPSAAMIRAVDEGRLRYDGAAAARLVARVGARGDECAGFIDTLGWRVRDLYSFGGVFEGTVPAGAPCEPLGFELIGECAFGSCVPGGDGHRCRGAVGVGARCDATHQCVDLEARLTPERGIDRLTLRCVPDTPAADEGTCAAWVEAGGACDGDGACWSGRCEAGRCETAEEGAGCVVSRECASGYCRSSDARCRPGDVAVGSPCDSDRACESQVCVAETCLPAGCGTF
ncbi:MAG TPA: hypothetical protein RMH99_21365 [Sandaracinaceae bacterium LLY-WYZ-13_1]|nr:hypothetical protein [Sandaracinaceae bacterium LLY-WYZ-13_1]